MEESEIKIPLLYVMGRDIDVTIAHRILSLTPCAMAVVCEHKDKELVSPFVPSVMHAQENVCREIASHIARALLLPVLLVEAGKELKAIYSSGDEEAIC